MTDDEPRGPRTATEVADAYDDWMLASSSQEKLGEGSAIIIICHRTSILR